MRNENIVIFALIFNVETFEFNIILQPQIDIKCSQYDTIENKLNAKF